MRMRSPEPNMRIVVGHTGHAYTSYGDRVVVEDVLPEDRSVLSRQGYTEHVEDTVEAVQDTSEEGHHEE